MLLPIQITWRGMEPSAALEGRVRALAQGLEQFSSQMIHCHVIIELPHKRGHQGHVYEVHIQVTVPGTELIAQHEHRELQSHEDLYVALRDAFRAMRRQLQDYGRKRRLDVKGSHAESEAHGDREAFRRGRRETGPARQCIDHRRRCTEVIGHRRNRGT